MKLTSHDDSGDCTPRSHACLRRLRVVGGLSRGYRHVAVWARSQGFAPWLCEVAHRGDSETSSLCKVTLDRRPSEPLIGLLLDRFTHVEVVTSRCAVVVRGIDQAAVRALLLLMWDAGFEVHAMTWTHQPGPLSGPGHPVRGSEAGGPLRWS